MTKTSLKCALTASLSVSFALAFLVTESASAFQILSPTSAGCHERITLGALGKEKDGFLGDGLPSTASLLNRFVNRVEALGVPNDLGTQGVMKEMSNRYHWEGMKPSEIFVLASFISGVRSPDTGGSSIVDFNKIRSTHIRDDEQSAHGLRRREDDGPSGDLTAIAATRDRIGQVLKSVDATWAGQAYRTEKWTFAFHGEHDVTVFAPAFDLGSAAHTLEDTYAHDIRDENMKIIATSNYLEVILNEYKEDRDGPPHSDRLDQCHTDDAFDLMRITEARKQVGNLFVAVDGALASSGDSVAASQATLNTVFAYRAGCDRSNEYCGTEWYQQAKKEFSKPYSVGCGLVKPPKLNGPRPPSGPGALVISFLLLLPLLFASALKARVRSRTAGRLARQVFALVLFALLIQAPAQAFAFDDPTNGKPFLPWLWQDQFKPTIEAAGSNGNLGILTGTVAATALSHQYDGDIRADYGQNQKMSSGVAKYGAILGSGGPAIAIAVGQLFFDQQNGLMHTRAIALASATHITTALIAHRERPNGSNHLSFPSGHATSVFTTATSLAYAYGPWVGAPAFAGANFVAMSRIANDAHWFSDTVAAAGIGIFWARASYLSSRGGSKPDAVTFTPVLIPGGALASFSADF